MDFTQFEKGLNEAPNYSPERLKAHADKAAKLKAESLKALKALETAMNWNDPDKIDTIYEHTQKIVESYIDHLKTAP